MATRRCQPKRTPSRRVTSATCPTNQYFACQPDRSATMKQFLARLAPQNLPQSEPEALAGAVLGGNSRRVAGWIPATWWLLTAGLSYVGLLGFALAGHLQGTVACFVVAGLSDWAASRGTTRLSQLLRLAGWGEPLRSLIRWALLLSVLSQPLAVTVPLAAQAAALTLAVATQWLHQRQPPLRYLPGIADQPAETLAYARAYQRGSGWPAALLAADMAGALIAGLIPSPGLLIAIAAAVLGYAGVGLLAALRLWIQGRGRRCHRRTAARRGSTRQRRVRLGAAWDRPSTCSIHGREPSMPLPIPPLVIVREANHLVASEPNERRGHVRAGVAAGRGGLPTKYSGCLRPGERTKKRRPPTKRGPHSRLPGTRRQRQG